MGESILSCVTSIRCGCKGSHRRDRRTVPSGDLGDGFRCIAPPCLGAWMVGERGIHNDTTVGCVDRSIGRFGSRPVGLVILLHRQHMRTNHPRPFTRSPSPSRTSLSTSRFRILQVRSMTLDFPTPPPLSLTPGVSQGSNQVRDTRGSLRAYPICGGQGGTRSGHHGFLRGSWSRSDPSVQAHDAAFGSERTVEKPRARPFHQSAPGRLPGCPSSSNGGASRGSFAPFTTRPNDPVGSWFRTRASLPSPWTFREASLEPIGKGCPFGDWDAEGRRS